MDVQFARYLFEHTLCFKHRVGLNEEKYVKLI